MRKIQITGLVFAATFAFSMISASGASALPLFDICSEKAPVREFATSNCDGGGTIWGWLEIIGVTAIHSLVTQLTIVNTGLVTVKVLCEVSVLGALEAKGESELTELLTSAEEAITLAKPVTCTNIANCSTPKAAPLNLPWHGQLVEETSEDAKGDLLGPHSGSGGPGWFVECGGTANECTKGDTILKVENLEAESKIDLTFPEASETKNLPIANCTNGFEKEGIFQVLIPILLSNVSPPAIRFMF